MNYLTAIHQQGVSIYERITGKDWLSSLAIAALVGGGDVHIFAVFGDCPTSYLDALGLEKRGQLVVGEGVADVFFFDELFDLALEDDEGRVRTLGTV